jgi:hypothetical protein
MAMVKLKLARGTVLEFRVDWIEHGFEFSSR